MPKYTKNGKRRWVFMAKVKNVEIKILETEGFEVRIKNNGKDLRGDKGGLPQWPGLRASRNAMTVSQWKGKFSNKYPGYEVDVLDVNGEVVSGNTLLATVRDTYIDDDDENGV
jgi:hypothetical protein